MEEWLPLENVRGVSQTQVKVEEIETPAQFPPPIPMSSVGGLPSRPQRPLPKAELPPRPPPISPKTDSPPSADKLSSSPPLSPPRPDAARASTMPATAQSSGVSSVPPTAPSKVPLWKRPVFIIGAIGTVACVFLLGGCLLIAIVLSVKDAPVSSPVVPVESQPVVLSMSTLIGQWEDIDRPGEVMEFANDGQFQIRTSNTEGAMNGRFSVAADGRTLELIPSGLLGGLNGLFGGGPLKFSAWFNGDVLEMNPSGVLVTRYRRTR